MPVSLKNIVVIFLLLCGGTMAAQTLVQNFNQSVNQIGSCWQNYNMEITTKNTINKANQKKALVGSSPLGKPAYFFTSPLMQFNGTGTVEFSHKLTANDGNYRNLTVTLLDQAERPVKVIHQYDYRSGGTAPNGNPTNVISVSVPVTWTGVYILKWEFNGTGGGSSVAMVDDININATDVSNSSNNNGYGYCRPDDVVFDTVCAGSTVAHKLPYPIAESDWTWDQMSAPGVLDSTVVPGVKDTIINFTWGFASGDYQFEATEIRYPYMTTSYSVLFNIHVLPAPEVTMNTTSGCPGDSTQVCFNFTGTAPFNIQYTDGDSTYTQVFNSNNGCVTTPLYLTTHTIDVLDLTDATGCGADPNALPSGDVTIFPQPLTGPIIHQ